MIISASGVLLSVKLLKVWKMFFSMQKLLPFCFLSMQKCGTCLVCIHFDLIYKKIFFFYIHYTIDVYGLHCVSNALIIR